MEGDITLLEVEVPSDCCAGSEIVVVAPDGHELVVIVPEGVGPGCHPRSCAARCKYCHSECERPGWLFCWRYIQRRLQWALF